MSRLKRLTGHLALLLAICIGGWAVTSQVAPVSAAAPLPPKLYILTSDNSIAVASANTPGSMSTPLTVEGLTAGDALAAKADQANLRAIELQRYQQRDSPIQELKRGRQHSDDCASIPVH